ncbi:MULTISPECIES: MaoC family dehydratase [Pandoraea]|uniref:MaoC family dehydratase n=1 Tax=Pandoraea TaxID=93217 RepID=UPI001F5E1C95|nr:MULTISPECIES: MaoC family dehydratase [Pandoraea]MCI3204763.1 dehydratase [Pandoraea sp. LA3]MDN4582791.1 dehydratase [Pandoraea capi]
MATLEYYFEDFAVGDTFDLGEYTFTADEIVHFARQFDPQPFHIDEAAGRESHFGGLVASGWHTCSIMMRMNVDKLLSRSSSMGSPGVEQIEWLKPVRPGDTVTVTSSTLEVRASKSRPDRGIVRQLWTATNQHGEEVCRFRGTGLYRKRGA